MRTLIVGLIACGAALWTLVGVAFLPSPGPAEPRPCAPACCQKKCDHGIPMPYECGTPERPKTCCRCAV